MDDAELLAWIVIALCVVTLAAGTLCLWRAHRRDPVAAADPVPSSNDNVENRFREARRG